MLIYVEEFSMRMQISGYDETFRPQVVRFKLKVYQQCQHIFAKLVEKQAQRRAAADRSRHKSYGRIFPRNAGNGFELFPSF